MCRESGEPGETGIPPRGCWQIIDSLTRAASPPGLRWGLSTTTARGERGGTGCDGMRIRTWGQRRTKDTRGPAHASTAPTPVCLCGHNHPSRLLAAVRAGTAVCRRVQVCAAVSRCAWRAHGHTSSQPEPPHACAGARTRGAVSASARDRLGSAGPASPSCRTPPESPARSGASICAWAKLQPNGPWAGGGCISKAPAAANAAAPPPGSRPPTPPDPRTARPGLGALPVPCPSRGTRWDSHGVGIRPWLTCGCSGGAGWAVGVWDPHPAVGQSRGVGPRARCPPSGISVPGEGEAGESGGLRVPPVGTWRGAPPASPWHRDPWETCCGQRDGGGCRGGAEAAAGP